MEEFFRDALADWSDPREVVTDPRARYFGTELSERSLVPGDDAIRGEIRYRDWPGRIPVSPSFPEPRLPLPAVPRFH